MKIYGKVLAAAGLMVGISAVALAQVGGMTVISLPQVTNVSQSDLVKVIPGGHPSVGDQYAPMPLLTLTEGYYKSAPATGFTYTFGTNIKRAMFAPTTTLSTGSITLPPITSDGQVACASSTQIVTTLTMAASGSDTLNNGLTAFTALGHACYVASLSNTTWDRAE